MDKRRRNLKRKNRARFRRMLVLFIVVSIFSLILYSLNMFFKIKNIVIYDNYMYEESLIIEYLDVGDDHNLLFFNKQNLADKIVDYFPYIQSVEIERKYPDTIEIYVENARELCSFHWQGTSYLLDYDLSVLRPITIEESKESFRIFGFEQDDIDSVNSASIEDTDRVKLLREIIVAFEENSKIYGITEINITKLYDVRVKFGGKYEIYLGDADDLAHKMKFFDEVLKKLTPSDIGVIDISSSSEARFRPVQIPNSPYPEIDEEIGDVIPEYNAPETLEPPEIPEFTEDDESFNMVLPNFETQDEIIESFDVLMPEIHGVTQQQIIYDNVDEEVLDEISDEEVIEAFGPKIPTEE